MNLIEKIVKNNVLMGVMAVATFAIVAYVMVYKPWKAQKALQQNPDA